MPEEVWEYYQSHALVETARRFRICPTRLSRVWRSEGKTIRSAEETWKVKPRRAPSDREQSIGWYYATHTLYETAEEFEMTESGVRGVLKRLGIVTRSYSQTVKLLKRSAGRAGAPRVSNGQFLALSGA